MPNYTIQNKKAWEYNAYDFWVKEAGLSNIPGEFTAIAEKKGK